MQAIIKRLFTAYSNLINILIVTSIFIIFASVMTGILSVIMMEGRNRVVAYRVESSGSSQKTAEMPGVMLPDNTAGYDKNGTGTLNVNADNSVRLLTPDNHSQVNSFAGEVNSAVPEIRQEAGNIISSASAEESNSPGPAAGSAPPEPAVTVETPQEPINEAAAASSDENKVTSITQEIKPVITDSTKADGSTPAVSEGQNAVKNENKTEPEKTNTGSASVSQPGGTSSGGTPSGGTPSGSNASTTGQATGNPSVSSPTTGSPSTGNPTTGNPTTGSPSGGTPSAGGQGTANPSTGGQTTGGQTTGSPADTGGLTTASGTNNSSQTKPQPGT